MIIEFEGRIAKLAKELLELTSIGKANDPLYQYLLGAKEEAERLKRFFEKQFSSHIETCHGKKGGPDVETNQEKPD